jgi:hypothetical protein
MSTYKGARGPNVSQYVQQLNQLSPVQQPLDELAPSADDFSAFLNEDFYDVNGAPLPNFDVPIDLDADLSTTAQPSQSQPSLGNNSRKHSVQTSAGPNMEFNLGGKYSLSLLYFLRSFLCLYLVTRSLASRCILCADRRPMTAAQGACKPRHCALPACFTPTLRVWASRTAAGCR